ncbi:MAG TPA: dTDP-4-dehydrorhamnose reductase [Castellaniella sp.]|uniref:dTDP-4-dehydrorhamnose reductase n=1 Tax=Castellaniella sp. TaxID=1955812 RepID=UPI002EDFB217
MRTRPEELQILVTGANGQLGRALQALPVASAHYHFTTRAQLDITQAQSIEHWLDAHPTDALINAAAYTAVDRASREPDLAMAANARAPGLLAQICASRGVRLFHISTDYVFDGTGDRAHREDDATAPQNTYGRSKLLGEQAALCADPSALILRTSWVFSDHPPNFVCTMLHLGAQYRSLQVVADQIGGPTWAGHLARVLHQLVQRPSATTPGGIYHFSGNPWVSWYEFAQEIFAQAQACGQMSPAPALQAIRSDQWPTPEPRPANSRLDTHKLEALLGPLERDWKKGLSAVLATVQSR